MTRPTGPEPITSAHIVVGFDCGAPELNGCLTERALRSEETARTFVIHRDLRVVGYYALSMASVSRGDVPRPLQRNTPAQIPCIRLGRLAVDLQEQGHGLGKALVKDALLKATQAVKLVAAKAILIDAIDDRARMFYESIDFLASPTNPLQVYRSMKDIINALP